jgi:hypothetical protein
MYNYTRFEILYKSYFRVDTLIVLCYGGVGAVRRRGDGELGAYHAMR